MPHTQFTSCAFLSIALTALAAVSCRDATPWGEDPCSCAGHTAVAGGSGADGPQQPQHVAFDWSADPGARPQGMRVWLYPRSWEGEPIPVDLRGHLGGNMDVPPGIYHIVTYNNDTEWTRAEDTADYGLHSLATRDASLLEPLGSMARGRDTGTERVAACPDDVWADAATNRYIGPGDTLTLAPRPQCCHYTFRFTGLARLGSVAKASASITGMSAGISLSTLGHRGDACTHPLAAAVDTAAAEIKGSFTTFGPAPAAAGVTRHNRMALYLVMTDGSKYKITLGDNLDVTSQIDSAPDPGRVDIVVQGVRIPQPGTQGGGFDAHVNDWDDEHHDIPV